VSNSTSPGLGGIESHSIEYVPENERHGRVRDQGPFWFLSNFHFFAIAIGFVGPSLGLSLSATALAGTLGIVLGTAFQAFHASQGPEMGLPQMIQSRAQFGYRGVMVPLIGTLISLMGYNVVSTVLVSSGAQALWGLNRTGVALTLSLSAAVLAIWGYDWLHRVFKLLFWICLPLFTLLTLAILFGRVGAVTPPAVSHFTWAAFLTQMASAASFNVTAAPYVSDYSRYLPRNTSRALIIGNVFAGAGLSAIWLIIVGAWLATRLGDADALLALARAGNMVIPHLGSLLAAGSIAALVATVGMNAYSGMLTFVTTVDSLRPVRPTRRLRIIVIAALMLLWIGASVGFGGNAIAYVNGMLVLMLYFLMPWTAVNLIDYFVLQRGRYSIPDLFRPDGIYGEWGMRGLTAYAVGFAASIPFFVVPGLYIGPIASRMGGVDVGWLVSGAVSAATYVLFNPASRAAAVQPVEAE
jgi:NCS1 family nucleobase:cation symporter-1